jgi:hypothetical protein
MTDVLVSAISPLVLSSSVIGKHVKLAVASSGEGGRPAPDFTKLVAGDAMGLQHCVDFVISPLRRPWRFSTARPARASPAPSTAMYTASWNSASPRLRAAPRRPRR